MKLPVPEPIDSLPQPKRRRYLDVHVHPWPQRVYAAVTRWFDELGWNISERYCEGEVDQQLGLRGVTRYVALVYAHRAGMARELNRWMTRYGQEHPRAIPFATVHPDDNIQQVLTEAFDVLKLRGLKLHCHVMGIAPDDSRLDTAYEMLRERDLPVTIHAGTMPESTRYPRPVEQVSGLARLGRVLDRFPGLRCILPHLGAPELDMASELLQRHPGLQLDCTMTLARYFPLRPGREWIIEHHDRIFYGTDFPILPYEYDRERRCIFDLQLGEEIEEALFWGNGARFLGIEYPPQDLSRDSQNG